jgi:YesN/AraC family two-component response regulator
MELFSHIKEMKIMLVDDDEWIRDSMRFFFEAEGSHLLALQTAEEGISILRDHSFDLFLVDYRLPGMDGLEFIRRISSTQPDAIKILISAFLNNNIVSEAKKLNIHGFIEKPFSSDTIIASLGYVIKLKERGAN